MEKNHSPAYNFIFEKFENGIWPIDTVEHLRTSWRGWSNCLTRFQMRSDEMLSIERVFKMRAKDLGVTLQDEGNSHVGKV